MADVKFLYGSQSGFDALQTKDENTLYFCTDTGKLYKGSTDFTDNIIVTKTKPETPVAGKIYVLSDTATVETYTSSGWVSISNNSFEIYSEDHIIDDGEERSSIAEDFYHGFYDDEYWWFSKYQANNVTLDKYGNKVLSAFTILKTLSEFRTQINYTRRHTPTSTYFENTKYVNQVTSAEEAAKLKISKYTSEDQAYRWEDKIETVTIPGVVTTPTWDAAARKLTLPISDAEAVEVNLGKDIFIDPTAANGYNAETNTIDLYLNDGTEDADPTKVSIPASALVDIYTGTTSNGTNVTVSDDNVIKVDLVIDPVEGNALVLTETGLKVDLSAYATTETVTALDARVAALESAPAAAQWGTF